MSYDPTVPSAGQRIADTQAPIQNNFQLIQSGASGFKPIASNFDNRTPLGVDDDPSPIPNVYSMYCKEDSTGKPELFGIDEAGVISQFTSTEHAIAQTGFALLVPGLVMQWGRDTMLSGTNVLTVTFPKEFSAIAFMVNSTPYSIPITGSTPREWGVSNITATTFDARAFNGNVPGDTEFGWLALGPL